MKQQDKSNSTQNHFKINNRLENDPDLIFDGFCKYFTDLGEHLANKIPNMVQITV